MNGWSTLISIASGASATLLSYQASRRITNRFETGRTWAQLLTEYKELICAPDSRSFIRDYFAFIRSSGAVVGPVLAKSAVGLVILCAAYGVNGVIAEAFADSEDNKNILSRWLSDSEFAFILAASCVGGIIFAVSRCRK